MVVSSAENRLVTHGTILDFESPPCRREADLVGCRRNAASKFQKWKQEETGGNNDDWDVVRRVLYIE